MRWLEKGGAKWEVTDVEGVEGWGEEGEARTEVVVWGMGG